MIMNMLERLMRFLIDLNEVLYNWVSHTLFFILFLVVLNSNIFWLKTWNLIGLGVYFILAILSFFRKKGGVSLKTIKEDPLSLLVGFNLCVWVSLLSFPIILMLAVLDEKDKKLNKNRKK